MQGKQNSGYSGRVTTEGGPAEKGEENEVGEAQLPPRVLDFRTQGNPCSLEDEAEDGGYGGPMQDLVGIRSEKTEDFADL